MEMNNDDDYSITFDHDNLPKRYLCEIEGCGKSYSSRQNRYRHKIHDHALAANQAKLCSKKQMTVQASLDREREIFMEMYFSMFDKLGEEHAAQFIKNNKTLKKHLVPLRRTVEADLAERSTNADKSQSIVEKQLADYESAVPEDCPNELAAFQAVMTLMTEATPQSIQRLKQFATAIASLTTHLEDYSEVVSSKLKQTRALKSVLDEMYLLEEGGVEEVASPVTVNSRKRKRTVTVADIEDMSGGSSSSSSSSMSPRTPRFLDSSTAPAIPLIGTAVRGGEEETYLDILIDEVEE